MKKILYFLFILTFISCEKDESLDPRPLLVPSQFVRLDITNKILDINKMDEVTFGGSLTTPADNVATYDLFVRRESNDVVTGNFVKLLTITSFPSDLVITPKMIADALGILNTNFIAGDIFQFRAISTGNDGVKIDYNSLSSAVKSQKSMKQGYKFSTQILPTAAYTIPEYLNNYNNYIP